jgi:hypothetical protein
MSDWWPRFAQATLDGTCIPCPECDHRHDCWLCKTARPEGCHPQPEVTERGSQRPASR